MKTRTWPYGTRKTVHIFYASTRLIGVLDEEHEAHMLLGHGMYPVPFTIGDKGTMVFTEGGPTGGYWKLEQPGDHNAT